MDNHPGNPLEKHISKRTDGTNIDLDTYLAISFRRRIKPFTLSWAAGTSSTYILSSSEAHDCVRGFIKTNFEIVGIRRVLVFLSFQRWIKPSHSLRPSAGLFYLHKSNRIWETALSGKHKNDYRLFGYRWEANGEGGRRKGES